MGQQIKPERLDRLLSRLGYCSRREVRTLLRQGLIEVDGNALASPSAKVKPTSVRIQGAPLDHPEGLTLIFHKPVGCICSRKEEGRLVYDYLPEQWMLREPKLSCVGRLDMDTSGLLILTDDGQLNHRLTAPNRKVPKHYQVRLDSPLQGNEAEIFASGTLMLDAEETPCLPATLNVLGTHEAELIIAEGRYHQVRRMFAAIGNHVVTLKRSRLGSLSLDGLSPEEFRVIDKEVLLDNVFGADQA